VYCTETFEVYWIEKIRSYPFKPRYDVSFMHTRNGIPQLRQSWWHRSDQDWPRICSHCPHTNLQCISLLLVICITLPWRVLALLSVRNDFLKNIVWETHAWMERKTTIANVVVFILNYFLWKENVKHYSVVFGKYCFFLKIQCSIETIQLICKAFMTLKKKKNRKPSLKETTAYFL
jgi:hypothetical protein